MRLHPQRVLATALLTAALLGISACGFTDTLAREQLGVASDFMVGITMDDRARIAGAVPDATAERFSEVLARRGQGAGARAQLTWEGEMVTVAIEGQDMPFELVLDDSEEVPLVMVYRGEDRAELELIETESGWRVNSIDGHLVDEVIAGLAVLDTQPE